MNNTKKLLRKKHKALSDGNKQQLIAVCVDLAQIYFKDEQYNNSIAEYKIVADNYNRMGKLMDYGRANRMIGEAHAQLREYEMALKHQKIHLDMAKKESDKLEEQRALATIGHTYLTDSLDTDNKDSLHLAYKSFRKSLTICESLRGIHEHEHMDMQARLLSNLGIVQASLDNNRDSVQLLEKSIDICLKHDIFEQLERAYAFLGTLYKKLREYSKAIHQYSLAIEVAKRLEGKNNLIASSLAAKADILIKLNDYKGAKVALLKAYKLKCSNKDEHETITRNLKVIAAICKTEEELLNETSDKVLKKLYEKMGDGLCELKNYEKAIEYYQKMLECARKNGEDGKELSPCYVSLAQTYSDNEQYDLALEYFRKEYDLDNDDFREGLGTLFSIADTLESADRDFIEIDNVYKEAIEKCTRANDIEAEKKTLSRYNTVLKKFNKHVEVNKVYERLCDIGYISGETESEASEHTPQIGDDVSIGNITDISDGSDLEMDERKPRDARKKRAIAIKRNDKGETQLHTACIRGNLTLVQHLIEQGHTINVRDNCGWLPLHEACNFGHFEIIKLLLQKGALVNDRGGIECNGITPLYDAASNGHLEIVELLLGNGASPCVKTDNGDTALNTLKRWRSNNLDLDLNTEQLYERIVGRMSLSLEKSGHDLRDNENVTDVNPLASSNRIGKLRRNVVESDNSSDEEPTLLHNTAESPRETDRSSTEEYRRVMEDLRFRNSSSENSTKKRKIAEKKNALIQSTSTVSNWLEDDIGVNSVNNKKRKTSDMFTTTSTRSSSSVTLSRNRSFNSSRSSDGIPDTYLQDVDFDETITPENVERFAKKNKQKIQTSLFRAGFEVSGGNRKSDPCSSTKSSQYTKQHQSRFTARKNNVETEKTSQTPKKTLTNNQVVLSNSSTVPVDVRIDDRLYRVPISVQEINTLTIKWLGQEASKRYCKKQGVKPTLELETSNGAILEESDFLSVLFPYGQLQSDEIRAKIIGYSTVSLLECYEEVCLNSSEEMDPLITEALQQSSTIKLQDKNLRQKLRPLLTSLNRSQNSLQILNISGNFVTDNCIELICNSLTSLENLKSLDLSLNHLTVESAKNLSTALQQTTLQHLTELNLSHNNLGDESLTHLSMMTRYLNLKILKLVDVGFTSDIFANRFNSNVELCLEYVNHFDISHNELNKDDLLRFLQCLRSKNLEYLNVGNNKVTQEGFLWEFVQLFDRDTFPQLKELNISRCMISDFELYELLRLLSSSNSMKSLDVSYNNNLTSVSLRRIIEHGNLMSSIKLIGCNDLLKSFTTRSDFRSHPDCKLNELILSTNTSDYANECDTLISKFNEIWNDLNVRKTATTLRVIKK